MLTFEQISFSASGKTKIFEVKSGGLILGKISFFGRWRKYCFYPDNDTLFDHLCLTEIAEFCKKETNVVFKRN